MYDPYDHYFKKAKKKWYKARSVFKLEEINDKFHIFETKSENILDIWCAPGSWIQFVHNYLNQKNIKNYKIVGLDIQKTNLNLSNVFTYIQDISDYNEVEKILKNLSIEKLDIIMSDMAPNTIWVKDIDAIRSINLLEKCIPIYEKFLSSSWKIVIKIFMWPWFDEFVKKMKEIYNPQQIKIFKPKSCRNSSKETYIIKT